MITTISLVNIHHHSHNFFLVMRTFKIYSLRNFQICNTVLLTIVILLYITSYNWKFVPFDNLHSFCPVPSPCIW